MWKVKRSKIHGTGIFATREIEENTKIIQYIGEKILKSEGDKRSEKRLNKYLRKSHWELAHYLNVLYEILLIYFDKAIYLKNNARNKR